jgi:ProP effector
MPTEEIPPNAAPSEPPGVRAADPQDALPADPLPADSGATAQAPGQPEQPEQAAPELSVADAPPPPETESTPSEAAPADASTDGAQSPAADSGERGLSPAQTAVRLAELFPALFAGPPKPIKLRIQADIQERAPGVFTRRVLSFFLSRHTTTTPYLKALVGSQQRFDLDGQAAGDIAPEHLQAATEELARRRQIVEARRAAERAQRGQGPRGASRSGAAPASATPVGDTPAVDGVRAERPPRGPARERPGPRNEARAGQRADTRDAARPPRPERTERHDRPAHPPRPDAGRRDTRAAPRGPATGAGQGQAAQRPPADFVPADPARRERAFLLRAWETSSLTKANFCALKRLTEAEFDAQLELARQERSGPRPS